MASPDPTVIGRYEVVSRLGQGGMGSLYLAKDPKIGRLVAIKLVRQEFDSPEARQRFAREAQSAGTLRHPNIVTIFDVDEHDGLPFIAMEYIDGETLAEIVKRKAPVPVTKKLQWLEDLCAGLAYAHRQGVIHRDIKPANLMVDTDGVVKILDFGLARSDESKFTRSEVILGTPNYLSPEQIRGDRIDTRSDIFSVGAVLYELLACKVAFPGAVHQTLHKILHEEPEPLEASVPGLDPEVQQIVNRALAKDCDSRYPDLSQMKNDLAEARLRMEPAADFPSTVALTREARRTQSGRMTAADRELLQRRRDEQISTLLDEARKLFEQRHLDKARVKCEEALTFDPDHPRGQQLMDEIAAEAERARQIQETLRRARKLFAEGGFEAAIAAAADVLTIDPNHEIAKDLQRRAQSAIDLAALKARRASSGSRISVAPARKPDDAVPAGKPAEEPAEEQTPRRLFLQAALGLTVTAVAGVAGYYGYSPRAEDPVVPAAAPTGTAAPSQDDKDIIAAYDLLKQGEIAKAQALALEIGKRNRRHPGLRALRAAIDTRFAEEVRRQRPK